MSKTGERLERRLAAILASDVVGYSRMMAADEAGTLVALREDRERIIEPLIAATGAKKSASRRTGT